LVYSNEDVRRDFYYYWQDSIAKYAKNFSRLIDVLHESDRPKEYSDTVVRRCFCYWTNDTMYMRFDGREGDDIIITLHGDSFQFHATRTTDFGGWLQEINDTVLTPFLLLSGKHQYLKLNTKPLFQEGQQLTGYLAYTTQYYYFNWGLVGRDTLPAFKRYVTFFQRGKLYFTCQTHYMKSVDKF
jgi:hypothetical protein